MLVHLQECENTNRLLLDDHRYAHGDAVYTLHQKVGRGTKGHLWQEAPGKGLALSVLLCDIPIQKTGPLPLLCGLAAVKAIQQVCGVSIQLKWCNDLLAGNKKLGGILCESRISGPSCRIVAGIGINLFYSQQDFIDVELPFATSLAVLGAEVTEETLSSTIRLQFLREVDRYLQGRAEWRDEYRACCVTLGSEIEIQYPTGSRVGKALDIAADASLICSIAGKTVQVYGDEVSVRGLYGYL